MKFTLHIGLLITILMLSVGPTFSLASSITLHIPLNPISAEDGDESGDDGSGDDEQDDGDEGGDDGDDGGE